MTQKNKMAPGVKDGVVTLKLSEVEVDALLDVLIFARGTANLIIANEEKTGAPISKKILRYHNDAKELMKIILMDLEIGTPSPGEIN